MNRRFLLLCTALCSLSISFAFDAGFLQLSSLSSSTTDTTHFTMTVCALYRVTIDYLKTTTQIDTTYLESQFRPTNGQCSTSISNDIVNVLQNVGTNRFNSREFQSTIETIASANTKTDLKEVLEDDSHFDSESFRSASQLVLKRYQATIQSIEQDDNYDQARKTFGEMLHTIQDFYSHTNYIELGGSAPHQVLARRIFRPAEFARRDLRTCISCPNGDCQSQQNIHSNVLRFNILTSGYFVPIGLDLFQSKKPYGKCSHGGTFDGTANDEPTGGINKDNLQADHGHLHHFAADVAYQATVQVLNQLRQDIGDDRFALFLSLNQNLNSLVISIDTTYSNVNFLDLAKTVSMNIVNQYQSSNTSAPYNYILTIFDHSKAELILNTHQPNDLISAIETLQTNSMNSSSTGEMYYHSLVESLKKCEYSSVIYTFSDSPANDQSIQYQARSLLRNKNSVIYSFLSSQFNQTDNDRLDLTSISGGLTIPIVDSDQSVLSEFILRQLEWTKLQTILTVQSTGNPIQFIVDRFVEELYIHISSNDKILNITEIELYNPSNVLYSSTENVRSTNNLYLQKIVQPVVGIWRLIAPTSNVEIVAKTNLSCSSILLDEMQENIHFVGYTRLTNEPIINSNLSVFTSCDNLQFSNVNINLIDQSNNLLSNYSPNRSDSLGSLTQIRIPQQRFRLQTIFTLADSTQIQRTEKQIFSPTYFSIELYNRPRLSFIGQFITFRYILKSTNQETNQIRLQIIDTLNLLGNDGISKDLTLNGQIEGTERLFIPRTFQSNSTTNLVIFSVSKYDTERNEYIYENDEIASIYLDSNRTSFSTNINSFLLFFLCIFSMKNFDP